MRIFSLRGNRQRIGPFRPLNGKKRRPSRFTRPVSGRRVLKGLTLSMFAFIFMLGATLLYQGMCHWDFFQITSIDIDGMKKTNKKELMAMSGVDVHSNLLDLKPAQVEEALEKHPWVAHAMVNRDWPNRLYISVEEKKPVAMINRRDGLFYLDKNGVPFWQAAACGDLDYPVLTGGFGDGKVHTTAHLAEALSFLQRARRSKNHFLSEQSISEIHLSPEKGLVIYLLDRTFPIYIGTGEIKKKYYRLASILQKLYRKKELQTIAFIDMNYMADEVLVSTTKAGKGRG